MVANHRESRLVYVPTKGGVDQSSRQQFVLEGVRRLDHSHPGVERVDMFYQIAFAVEGG